MGNASPQQAAHDEARSDMKGGCRSPKKSETPCWTCRRRRVQCDKDLPTCSKCHAAGKECLGYTKPLVWAKGVASRGKMMGQTFAQVQSAREKESAAKSSPSEEAVTLEAIEEIDRKDMIPYSPQKLVSVQGGLVDPVFQDLKPITRYYLDYFAQKLCCEAVLHDLPGQNPFRDLMSTVGTSPLLLKSMLAAAARHITNLTESSSTFSPIWASNTPETKHQLQSMAKSSRYHAYWYKQAALAQLRDDLKTSKGTAFEKDVIVASISLFIWIDLLEAGKNTWRVHLEGMKGLVGLQDSLTIERGSPVPVVTESRLGYSSINNITSHPFFFDICITFDIMGTTLSRPYKIGKPLAPTPTVYHSLSRAEKTSFIGCPAELLYLILVINWKSWAKSQNSTPEELSPSSTFVDTPDIDGEAYTNIAILNRIRAFSPIEWSEQTTAYIPQPDTQERIHVASAYQYAVLIYFHRVLSSMGSVKSHVVNDHLPQTLLSLAHETLTHLSQIAHDHPFIKCIVWPTFIAGAELVSNTPFAPSPHIDPSKLSRASQLTTSSTEDERNLARNLLHVFWLAYRSVNVINAARVLEEIWKKNDEIVRSMTSEEYKELDRAGAWSRGVLNCAEIDKGSDFWVDDDVDWLFV